MQTFTVKLDHAGRILVPSKFRKQLGWTKGSELVVSVDEDSMRLQSRKQAVRRAQDYFPMLGPKEQLWSEELIQDRRKEAARERDG